jgi:AraC-like DNA-binding protein
MLVDARTLRRLCRARDVLREDTAITVRDVARDAGISPFHFIRQFEAVFGATPHRFRTQARLERACTLLSAGQSVTEVCFAVGFSSVGSFSALFSRSVGTAPSAYRRQFVQVAWPRPVIPGCYGLMGALPRDAFQPGSPGVRTIRNSREASIG